MADTQPYCVALEDIEPGHYVAWLLDLPGCFSSGSTARLALESVPEAVEAHFAWLRARDSRLPLPADPVARLDAMRAHTSQRLFALQGMSRIVAVSGERWSARKVMHAAARAGSYRIHPPAGGAWRYRREV